MGCQCAKQEEEKNEELTRNENNMEGEQQYNNNIEQKEEIFGLSNAQDYLKQFNDENLESNENHENRENQENHENQENQKNENNLEKEKEKENEDKNAKYADYPEKMLELINKIRENPSFYADVIEDSIQNIIENQDDDETKPKIIYKKKVKVALCRGEPAFREAAEKLRNIESLPPLEFKNDICAPLPDNEEEVKDPTYLKEQIKILRETTNIDVFFKDLIKLPEVSALLMIVDDGEKNPGRKRNALLNKDFKYIGINSKFIGKTFIAYFTFSR